MQERRIHLAHQAMMLDDAHQLLAINRQQIKAHGRMMAELPQPPEDNMGIHIGDVNVLPQATAAKPALGSLGKLLAIAAMGAGLLTTGGAGALGLAAALKPAIAAPAPIDIEIPWRWHDGKMQFGMPRPVNSMEAPNPLTKLGIHAYVKSTA